MKKTLLFLFVLFSSMNVTEASAVKLVDYLVSSSGVSELLSRYGIKGSDKTQLEGYVSKSLSSFNGKNVNAKEAIEVLNKLPVTGDDLKLKNELQKVLSQPADKVKKEDFVTAVNSLIYLANRYGKSVVITCADCLNGALAKQGFKFGINDITNANTKNILSNVIPNNPRDLHTFISSRTKRFGLGDYSKVTADVMSKEDEKTFALFLASYENGSDDFKDVAKNIIELSKKNGKVNMFDSRDPNKIWRVVSHDMSGAELRELAKVLADAQEVKNAEKLSAEDAFNQVLRKKVRNKKELLSKYKAMKNKRCFFR